MLFLIDGYNLMHALGVHLGRSGPRGLEHARNRLLGFLHEGHGADAASVTVVFDAKHPPPHAEAETTYHGIHVLFARDDDEADDLIEKLIRRATHPKELAVVSDDRRLRAAALRRHCHAWGCGDYLDHLQSHRPARPPSPATDSGKPDALSPEETRHWLKEFDDVEGWGY